MHLNSFIEDTKESVRQVILTFKAVDLHPLECLSRNHDNSKNIK